MMKENKLYQAIQQMRVDCGWDLTDTDERLAKFTVIEAAELLECFLTENVDLENLQEEIADVMMYVLSTCIDHNWDYDELIMNKIKKVKEKYLLHDTE